VLVSQKKLRIGCFFSCLTDKHRFDAVMSFHVHFLKVFITAIVCLALIVDCHNSRTSGIRRTLAEHRADVYQSSREKQTPILYYFAENNWFSSQDAEPQGNYLPPLPPTLLKVSRHALAE